MHTHFVQHGAPALVEVQAHVGRFSIKIYNFRLMTMASSPRGNAALAG